MLSRFVRAFLARGKHLLISWLQSPSAVIWEPKKRNSVTASTFPPSFCHTIILVFWMLSFKPAFSLSLTCIRRLFSSSSVSASMSGLSVGMQPVQFITWKIIGETTAISIKNYTWTSVIGLQRRDESHRNWKVRNTKPSCIVYNMIVRKIQTIFKINLILRWSLDIGLWSIVFLYKNKKKLKTKEF